MGVREIVYSGIIALSLVGCGKKPVEIEPGPASVPEVRDDQWIIYGESEEERKKREEESQKYKKQGPMYEDNRPYPIDTREEPDIILGKGKLDVEIRRVYRD